MATINLQNKPTLKGVVTETVSFDSNGATLRGTLYKPASADGPVPGVIVTKLALVAPWLHDLAMAEGIYGGADAVAGLIAASEAEGAADTVLVGASATDTNSVMYQADTPDPCSNGCLCRA